MNSGSLSQLEPRPFAEEVAASPSTVFTFSGSSPPPSPSIAHLGKFTPASVCLNVCKVPTQNFFNEIGLDVELRPDYETFECRFVYGKKPPEMTSDPAFDTPCFGQCPISKMNGVETGSVAVSYTHLTLPTIYSV